MKPYIYRDFGSLVSLGQFTTVGNLMGFLVGRDAFFMKATSRFFDVSFALQDARGGPSWSRERNPQYDWPDLSPTQCARGEASLKSI